MLELSASIFRVVARTEYTMATRRRTGILMKGNAILLTGVGATQNQLFLA